jgi:hypothetical protein
MVGLNFEMNKFNPTMKVNVGAITGNIAQPLVSIFPNY